MDQQREDAKLMALILGPGAGAGSWVVLVAAGCWTWLAVVVGIVVCGAFWSIVAFAPKD